MTAVKQQTLDDLVVQMEAELGDGKLEDYDAHLDEYAALAEDPRSRWDALTRRAGRAIFSGAFADGERHALEARAIGSASGEPRTDDVFLGQMSHVWEESYDGGKIELLRERRRATNYDEDPMRTWWCSRVLAIECRLGNLAEASEEITKLAERGFDIPRDQHWLHSMMWIAEVCIALRDQSAVPMIYELLEPHRGTLVAAGGTVIAGVVDHRLSRLDAARLRLAVAVEQLEALAEVYDRWGAKPWAIYVRLDLARLLRELDDSSRSRQLAAAAAEEARNLGMRRVAHRAEEFLG